MGISSQKSRIENASREEVGSTGLGALKVLNHGTNPGIIVGDKEEKYVRRAVRLVMSRLKTAIAMSTGGKREVGSE